MNEPSNPEKPSLPESDEKMSANWFISLIKVLPAIKTKIQLTGLVIGAAAFVAVRFASPDAVVAQICAGSIGVLFLVFGQIFGALDKFPEDKRVKLVTILFLAFILFILALVTIILITVKPSKPNINPDAVGISFAGTLQLETVVKMVEDSRDSHDVIITFNSNCTDLVKKAKVEGGSLNGDNIKDFLEGLKTRIRDSGVDYSVKTIKEKVRYEIVCN
jgi:hypothetical protein